MVTVKALTASPPAENTAVFAAPTVVVNVPAPPLKSVFQKLLVPQVPVGVVPAPAVVLLLSQYTFAACAVPAAAAIRIGNAAAASRLERRAEREDECFTTTLL